MARSRAHCRRGPKALEARRRAFIVSVIAATPPLARTILRRVQWNGLLVGNRVRDQPHLFGIKARRGTMKVGVAPKAVPIEREDLLGVDGASLPDL